VVRRFSPAQLIVAGAGASVVRWGVMVLDPPLGVLVPLQALHALTYGAAHLGAILFITRAVPHQGMGSAQAFYATIAAGLALGVVGLVSGALFAQLGGTVFLVPTVVAMIGCAAGILLLRGWDGAALWTDDAEATAGASPTAPATGG
jgi:PPP family 3-phenylpropionic acid transporter